MYANLHFRLIAHVIIFQKTRIYAIRMYLQQIIFKDVFITINVPALSKRL